MLVNVFAVVCDSARRYHRITHQLKTDFTTKNIRNVTPLQHIRLQVYNVYDYYVSSRVMRPI